MQKLHLLKNFECHGFCRSNFKKITSWFNLWSPKFVNIKQCYISFMYSDYFYECILLPGYKTDGASWPPIIRLIFKRLRDPYFNAACIGFHDPQYNIDTGIPFNEVQDIFRQILEKSDMSKYAEIMADATQKFSFEEWTEDTAFDLDNQKFIIFKKKNIFDGIEEL